ncbi:hypothetical protein VNO77_47128 [Canavalia gladiata]|uniref:Uncharacterized protein n=1 Tax=Canavalia gladiata TaxID=3824 RepID=A0AAN9PID5_CANGL
MVENTKGYCSLCFSLCGDENKLTINLQNPLPAPASWSPESTVSTCALASGSPRRNPSMKEALRFGCQFLSLEKGSSVSLEGRGYHNLTLLQAIKCQFNSAFQHSMKSALLEGKEDSEDGLRAGCLPSFPFSPLSPLSSAKTLSPHPTNSFSIRMSAEIPDRKRLPSSFPTRFKSIFLRDFGLTLLFLRGLMFRKRVPTCTVCIDCLPQCPLTGHFTEFLSTSKLVPKNSLSAPYALFREKDRLGLCILPLKGVLPIKDKEFPSNPEVLLFASFRYPLINRPVARARVSSANRSGFLLFLIAHLAFENRLEHYLPGTAGAALLMNVLPRVGTEPTALVASSSLEQFPSSSLLARPVSLRRLKVGQGRTVLFSEECDIESGLLSLEA